MPLNFLELVPREIRDKIYIYVLASPSGSVSLFPWIYHRPNLRFKKLAYDPQKNLIAGEDGIIDLSLLRTCRQIHRECKDLIWEHNRLRVPEPSKLFGKLQLYGTFHKIRRIQRIKIQVELLDWDELEWMSRSLKALVVLTQDGCLESIQLIATRDRLRRLDGFEDLANLKKHGENMDGRWFRAAPMSGDKFLHQRTFAINTGWPRFAHVGKQNWVREMLLDPAKPDILLKEIHDAFGGELYIDGLLTYKDHAEVVDIFNLDPRQGEIKILPDQKQANAA